jgi:hypothetical protein
MTKPLRTTTEQLDARLREQALEVAALVLALDIQSRRIAHAQANVDAQTAAGERRQLPGAHPQAGEVVQYIAGVRAGVVHTRRRSC